MPHRNPNRIILTPTIKAKYPENSRNSNDDLSSSMFDNSVELVPNVAIIENSKPMSWSWEDWIKYKVVKPTANKPVPKDNAMPINSWKRTDSLSNGTLS